MVSLGKAGLIDSSAYFAGDWSRVKILRTDGVTYSMGNVQAAVLELTREEIVHIGTAFPRLADLVIPAQAGMRFTGQATELHTAWLHAVLNDALADWSSNYNYPGNKTCSVFQTIQGLRRRACDQVVIEFRIFKAFSPGNIALGSSTGNDVVTSNFDWQGLDDSDNSMGQGGSSTAPLGYLWLPSPVAAVTTTP